MYLGLYTLKGLHKIDPLGNRIKLLILLTQIIYTRYNLFEYKTKMLQVLLYQGFRNVKVNCLMCFCYATFMCVRNARTTLQLFSIYTQP